MLSPVPCLLKIQILQCISLFPRSFPSIFHFFVSDQFYLPPLAFKFQKGIFSALLHIFPAIPFKSLKNTAMVFLSSLSHQSNSHICSKFIRMRICMFISWECNELELQKPDGQLVAPAHTSLYAALITTHDWN